MAHPWVGLQAIYLDADLVPNCEIPPTRVGVIPHTRLRGSLSETGDATRIQQDAPGPRRSPNRSRSSPRAIATFTLFGVVLVALILAVGPTNGLTFAPHSTSAPPSDALTTLADFPTTIQHVVVIMDENKEWSTVWEHGPYEVSLARTYANLSQFYAIRQASWPSYVGATSGDTPPAGPTPINVQNLADLTTAHGETWAQWSESAVGTCDRTDNVAHLYDTAHVPFVWYDDVYGNSAECNADVVPMTLTQMQTAFASGTLPNYLFITPNVYDDGHTYSRTCTPGVTNQPIAETECADAWLQALLNPLIGNTPLFAHTAVFITYDQTQTSDNSGSIVGASGGHVYASVVSPVVIPGYSATTPYTDTNLLTTTEWLLGLPGGTLQNDNWTLHPPMEDLFYPAVTGTVSDSVSHAGLPNATVSATEGSMTESRLTAPSGNVRALLAARNVHRHRPRFRLCAGSGLRHGRRGSGLGRELCLGGHRFLRAFHSLAHVLYGSVEPERELLSVRFESGRCDRGLRRDSLFQDGCLGHRFGRRSILVELLRAVGEHRRARRLGGRRRNGGARGRGYDDRFLGQ